MTHPTRRTPAHRPRPGRRRHRAASLGALFATLALGLTGQLTAHPAVETSAGTPSARPPARRRRDVHRRPGGPGVLRYGARPGFTPRLIRIGRS